MKQILLFFSLTTSLFAKAQSFEELVTKKTCEYLVQDKKALDSISTISNYMSRSMAEIIMTDSGRKYMMEIATVEGIKGTMHKVYSLMSKSCKEYNDALPPLILNESQPTGRFDFFTPIKGHEYEGIAIKDSLTTTRLGMALYQWGRATNELGIPKVEDALSIWRKLKGRNPDEREKNYITLGFEEGLEK